MANIGAGETFHAYLVKKTNVTLVDSLLKSETPITEIVKMEYMTPFRYRFLNSTELMFQPLSGYAKSKIDGAIFSSETEINPAERDKIYFIDGFMQDKSLNIMRIIPQVAHGAFLISKKFPRIMELQ